MLCSIKNNKECVDEKSQKSSACYYIYEFYTERIDLKGGK